MFGDARDLEMCAYIVGGEMSEIRVWSIGDVAVTGENRNTRIKTYPSSTLPVENFIWIDLESIPVLHGEKEAIRIYRPPSGLGAKRQISLTILACSHSLLVINS